MSVPTDAPPVAESNRKRLTNYNQQRGSRTGFSVRGAFLFGLVFVGMGVFIMLMGQRVVHVDPASVHAPYWVVTVCGACFGGGGLMVWGMAARQGRAERYRRDALRRYGGSDAHADFAWNPGGYTPPRWRRAVGGIIGAAFFTVFMSVFNWWAWAVPDSPWPVKAVVVVFDVIVVLVWWKTTLTIARCVKFGGSRVVFHHFPYTLDEAIALRWLPPPGVTRAEKGSFTFRCIEEYYEERRSGNDRDRWLVHDELCVESQSFDTPHDFPPGRPVELRFAPPPGAPSTRLSSERPVYWELEVRLALAGLDFEEWYLVPVYSR